MNTSCSVQPKEAKEIYIKAGEIFANKVISLLADRSIDNIATYSTETNDYRSDFLYEMSSKSNLAAKKDESFTIKQEGFKQVREFYIEIDTKLEEKFSQLGRIDKNIARTYFLERRNERFSEYFNDNKQDIAKKITTKRLMKKVGLDLLRIESISDEFEGITFDTPASKIGALTGKAIAWELLRSSGDFLLKQAKSSSSDIETQKRYFVDTMGDWTKGDNAYLDDRKAWGIYDTIYDATNKINEETEKWSEQEITENLDSAAREVFSDYFNKKMGTTSKSPKKGRSLMLMSKKTLTGHTRIDFEINRLSALGGEFENITASTPTEKIAEIAGVSMANKILALSGDLAMKRAKKRTSNPLKQKQDFMKMLWRWWDGDLSEKDPINQEMWKTHDIYSEAHDAIAKLTGQKNSLGTQDLFEESASRTIRNYFDSKNKATNTLTESMVEQLQFAGGFSDALKNVSVDTPLNDVARLAGITVANRLIENIEDHQEFMLDQAKETKLNKKTAKIYRADELADAWWDGKIVDDSANETFDDYRQVMEEVSEINGGDPDAHIDNFRRALKQTLSNYFQSQNVS